MHISLSCSVTRNANGRAPVGDPFVMKKAGRSLSPSFFPDRGEMPKKPEIFGFLLVLKIGQKKFPAGEKLVRGGESLVLSGQKNFAICA